MIICSLYLLFTIIWDRLKSLSFNQTIELFWNRNWRGFALLAKPINSGLELCWRQLFSPLVVRLCWTSRKVIISTTIYSAFLKCILDDRPGMVAFPGEWTNAIEPFISSWISFSPKALLQNLTLSITTHEMPILTISPFRGCGALSTDYHRDVRGKDTVRLV